METAKRVIGRPFPSGPAHPRYGQKGKGTVPRLSDGRTLYQLFRTYTEDAAKLINQVMNDRREDMELRVRCAAMILQRGWGDAPKHLMLTPLTDTSRANELTEADILQLVRSRPAIEVVPREEGPPSRGDEGGSLSGTGSSPVAEQKPNSVIDLIPTPEPSPPPVLPPEPLPVPDIPSFIKKDTPPTGKP